MKQRGQQIQKRQLTPFERVMVLSRALNRDEKIAIIKEYAAELNEPLYTAADVKRIVNQTIAQVRQRQPLMQGLENYSAELARLKGQP